MPDSKTRYDRSEEPLVISKSILDTCLNSKYPAECIALYSFLYYTSKWQGTNTAKATNFYIGKGLHWKSEKKVIRIKQELINIGLIEKVQRRGKDGKIKGYYIKVNFIWTQDKINSETNLSSESSNQIPFKPDCQKVQSGKKHYSNQTGKKPCQVKNQSNALSVNILNALKPNIYKQKISPSKKPQEKNKKIKHIIPPEIEMIKKYFQENNFKSCPKKYFHHYERSSWFIGKTKIKNWVSNADYWELNFLNRPENKNIIPITKKISPIEQEQQQQQLKEEQETKTLKIKYDALEKIEIDKYIKKAKKESPNLPNEILKTIGFNIYCEEITKEIINNY